MILMIAIGWVVVVPMLVVGGLYVASRILGARARTAGGAIDVTALVRAFAGLAPSEPSSDAETSGPAEQTAGAGY